MANENRVINLLPGSKDTSFFTQFLNWSLTIGRLLIILVETLALGTFLYRFNLDMKIVDLHDQIKANSFIVQNFANQEEVFRNLQDRLTLAKAYDEAPKTAAVFSDIVEMGRGRVTFRNLLVTADTVKIEAEAGSGSELAQFTDALKAYPQVIDVSIDKVENNTATAKIAIIISAKLKRNPNAISTKETDTSTVDTVQNPTQ